MSKFIFRNIPNLVVLFRVILIFIVIFLFSIESLISRIFGLGLLVIAALADWLDGFLARKLKLSSPVGAMLDTLGDRITENLLLIFFAYKQLVPLFVPLIFIARSLVSDFIRCLCYHQNIETFSIQKSKLGIIFVASRFSRVLYLLIKIFIFFLGGIILAVETMLQNLDTLLLNLKLVIIYGSVILVFFNLLRFVLLIYDSRNILKEIFTK